MKKLFTFAAVLFMILFLLGGCASIGTGGSAPATESVAQTAAVETSAEKTSETETIDLGDHPDWLLLPPIEVGYFFGIGVHEDLLQAKQLSIINAGQQFSTRITSALKEQTTENNGKTETAVTVIDKQVTDQVVYGAKFIDQYQDPQGRYWGLARAPLNCMLDAAEGVLLSYRLDVGQEEEEIKAVIDTVEKEVKKVEVYFKTEGTLTVTAVTGGKLYVDGDLVGDITGRAETANITLETGIHEVELRYGNGEQERRNVFIMKDLTAAVEFVYVEVQNRPKLNEMSSFIEFHRDFSLTTHMKENGHPLSELAGLTWGDDKIDRSDIELLQKLAENLGLLEEGEVLISSDGKTWNQGRVEEIMNQIFFAKVNNHIVAEFSSDDGDSIAVLEKNGWGPWQYNDTLTFIRRGTGKEGIEVMSHESWVAQFTYEGSVPIKGISTDTQRTGDESVDFEAER